MFKSLLLLGLALFASFEIASAAAPNHGDKIVCQKTVGKCTLDITLTEVQTPDGCTVSVDITIKCGTTECKRTRTRGCFATNSPIDVMCDGNTYKIGPGSHTWGDFPSGRAGCGDLDVN